MTITLTTPAMLFPAISLLLLAYTNRFLTIASTIRNLDPTKDQENTHAQINNLRKRIQLIKRMQEFGVFSFFLCVLSMLAIYAEYQTVGSTIFAGSLVLLLYSLGLSVREINISVEALDVHLSYFNLDRKKRK
jgi:predicted phage tail protein